MSRIVVLAGILAACGGTAPGAHVTSPSPSPTPDAITRAYVQVVHNYWVDLVAADGNAPTVCYNGPIDPAQCKARAEAQLAVQEKFLSDLDRIQAPLQFAGPNAALLQNLPTVISDLKAMIAASASGDKHAVVNATSTYIDLMRSAIEDALDQIDPEVNHQR